MKSASIRRRVDLGWDCHRAAHKERPGCRLRVTLQKVLRAFVKQRLPVVRPCGPERQAGIPSHKGCTAHHAAGYALCLRLEPLWRDRRLTMRDRGRVRPPPIGSVAGAAPTAAVATRQIQGYALASGAPAVVAQALQSPCSSNTRSGRCLSTAPTVPRCHVCAKRVSVGTATRTCARFTKTVCYAPRDAATADEDCGAIQLAFSD